MKILFVNETVVDVFVGRGWNNWSRFEVQRKTGKRPTLILIGGKAMSKEDYTSACTELTIK